MKNNYKIDGENLLEEFVIKFKEKTLANTVRHIITKKSEAMIILIFFYFVSDVIIKIAKIYGKDWDNYNNIKSGLFCITILLFIVSIFKDMLQFTKKKIKITKMYSLQECLENIADGAKEIRKDDNKIVKQLLKKNHLYHIEIMKEIRDYCNRKKKPEDIPTKKMINSFKITIIPIIITVITSIMFQKDAIENLISSLEIWSIIMDIVLTFICVATLVYLFDYIEGSKNTVSYERISDILSNLIIIENKKRIKNMTKKEVECP